MSEASFKSGKGNSGRRGHESPKLLPTMVVMPASTKPNPGQAGAVSSVYGSLGPFSGLYQRQAAGQICYDWAFSSPQWLEAKPALHSHSSHVPGYSFPR